MKPWHGVAKFTVFRFFWDIQQILQPSRHRVLNLVSGKTQLCLGPGQTSMGSQAGHHEGCESWRQKLHQRGQLKHHTLRSADASHLF
jgi:hypothetical protein